MAKEKARAMVQIWRQWQSFQAKPDLFSLGPELCQAMKASHAEATGGSNTAIDPMAGAVSQDGRAKWLIEIDYVLEGFML